MCKSRWLRKAQVKTNHNFGWKPCFEQLLATIPHIFSAVVGTLGTSTEDHMHIRVTLEKLVRIMKQGGDTIGPYLCLDDAAQAFLSN